MDISSLLNKFIGSDGKPNSNAGIAGGALTGGALALLMGNKGVRKLAGTAASVGGMALLGGMAVKAFQSWQNQSNSAAQINNSSSQIPANFLPNQNDNNQLELSIIKAMIAAAKADGHIDAAEQDKIFKQAQNYALSSEEKALIFDLISKPVSISEISNSVKTIEHKAEVYLASKIVCADESPEELKYLASLAESLALPAELVKQLDQQVKAVA